MNYPNFVLRGHRGKDAENSDCNTESNGVFFPLNVLVNISVVGLVHDSNVALKFMLFHGTRG